MTLKNTLLLTTAALIWAGIAQAQSFDVTFIDHIEAGLPEIDVYLADPDDVYLEDPSDGDVVVQITGDMVAKHRDSEIFASAKAIPHNPFDASAGGPFPKGQALGQTLDEWLSASGGATVSCDGDIGSVTAKLDGLVPGDLYTMWYAMVPMPPTVPFTGALDLPLGARDGSQSSMTADEHGTATLDIQFSPCLALSNLQVLSMLALAWHSDGKTYGSHPGEFGKTSHVQIFAPFPKVIDPQS